MELVIRARRADDLDACVALLRGVHLADGYPAGWPEDPRAWLMPRGLLAAWVAEDVGAGAIAGVPLGHVALCAAAGDTAAPLWSAAARLPPERIAAVARLFVAPRARGRGLGASLLAAARAEAEARGLRPALEVLDRDRAAIALYERTGWRRVASAPLLLANGERAALHYYLAPAPAAHDHHPGPHGR